MKLAVPKELSPGEQRVALVPGELARLSALGIDVVVQSGAGERRSSRTRSTKQLARALSVRSAPSIKRWTSWPRSSLRA